MEISEIITKAFLYKNPSIYKELDVIISELGRFSIDEILEQGNQEISKIDRDIRNSVNNALYYQESEEENIKKVANLIYTARRYFEKGILDADVKSILLFLSINCYLQINIDKFIENGDFNIHSICEKIKELLTKAILDIKALPEAPINEKMKFSAYTEGYSQNNIEKVYNLIEAIERGSNRGFHFNYLLENLIKFLYEINFPIFIEILSKQQNISNIIFYLQSFNFDELIKISNESSFFNKWINFEIVRQLTKKENKRSVISDEEIRIVKDVLIRINNDNFDFFKQSIKYFSRSKLYNSALGISLTETEDDKITAIISECFVFDKYSNNLENRDFLKDQFSNYANDEKAKTFFTSIFNQYERFLKELYQDEKFYLNNILLTDYANYILHYYVSYVDEELIVNKLKNLLDNIIFIDSEWAISESQQITKFHLYNSEIHILTYEYKNKNLNIQEITTLYNELLNNKILLKRYASEETIEFLKTGYLNINYK
ncbi:hypothetical protein G6R40_06355 [Chryseobacterium sp. POL2]|uniref:hypothetical protein n=1 Tax=Chryseobacterium sp. POL2 TaxID=2713414 RepID=UPI0013E19822|nr:hypothetical protein [Chryseobacterium sp. POL2]QIG89324.1 hypothetical protein G6R40_06355 [Chryseobacterium sp. POL2]